MLKRINAMIEPRFKVKAQIEEEKYGKFIIEPLDQGYGQTLGNSLRRVLLSSLKGAAVTMVKIDGIRHQFSTLSGLKEDIVELILNIKQLRLRYEGDEPVKMTLSVKKKGPISAKEIEAPPSITIINPSTYLGTLTTPKAQLSIDFWVEAGFGYSPFEDRKGTEIGIIPIDAVFTPVLRVNYKIESTRVGRVTDLDKLILEIWTDGSVAPKDALMQSAKILSSHLTHIYAPKEDESQVAPTSITTIPDEVTRMTIEELDLPTRIVNALRNGGIETVGDLLQISRKELMKIKNLGSKSMGVVEGKLKEKEVTLTKE